MSVQPLWLTTERLGLRRMTKSDFAFFRALYRDDDVMRYVGGAFDEERIAETFRTRILDYYDRHPGLGMWLTVERSSGSAVGCHNLNHIRGETFIQVGFFLASAAWGNGYATEMAHALLRYGFVDLELPLICGMTGVQNLSAQRVLEKIGLERRGERTFPAYAFAGASAWYEMERERWLAKRELHPAPGV